MATDTTKLAVLIDADNAQPAHAKDLLDEVAKYGTAHVKRAYGDIERRSPGDGRAKVIYVRNKPRAATP